MKNELFTLFITLLSTPASASNGTLTGAPLFLEVGEQRALHFDKIKQFSVSGDSIRHFRDPKTSSILLKALKPGLATLFVQSEESGNETRLIRIEQKPHNPHSTELPRALNEIHTTEVIDGGSAFILRGRVSALQEAKAISHLRDQFSASIIDETEIDPDWANRNEIELKTLLRNYPNLSLNRDRGEFRIEGGVNTLSMADSVRKQIKAIQPLVRTDIRCIHDAASTLYFKVFLLEVKKERMNELGISWPSLQPASIQLNPTQFMIQNSIDLGLHALTEKGIARVLSSPELVVKAPGQAELFSGGELPIRARSKFNDTVTWKNFGLTFRIDVKEFAGDRVKLTVETEISQLDTSLKYDQIPGVKTNRIKTLVDGVMGKPLLLSGLLQEDTHEKQSGLMGLAEIPFLGNLFSSSDYQNKRSELVAILLPHRNPPDSPQSRISSDLPKGYLPLPRNHMTDEEIEFAKKQKDYPWNVL